MNLVEIAGHLGADPETRVTPNGLKITTLRVATNSRRAGKDETIWWRATIFGDRFDKMMMHFKKGSSIIILGELNKPEIWMDKEGRPQITLEVVAEIIKFNPFGKAERPQDGSGNVSSYGSNNQQQSYQNAYSAPAQQQSYAQNTHAEPSPFAEPNYQSSNQGYGSSGNHNDEEIPF